MLLIFKLSETIGSVGMAKTQAIADEKVNAIGV